MRLSGRTSRWRGRWLGRAQSGECPNVVRMLSPAHHTSRRGALHPGNPIDGCTIVRCRWTPRMPVVAPLEARRMGCDAWRSLSCSASSVRLLRRWPPVPSARARRASPWSDASASPTREPRATTGRFVPRPTPALGGYASGRRATAAEWGISALSVSAPNPSGASHSRSPI